MHEPAVTDEMLFRLIIEHRDLLHLLGPYMRPGFKISMGIKPTGAGGPMFSCAITRDGIVSHRLKRLGGVADDGDTLEDAVEKAVRKARVQL